MPAFRDEIRAMMEGKAPLSPFDRLVGLRIVKVGDGASQLNVVVDERFHNPAHVLHGGILSGLVDSAMAYAVSTVLEADESCTNIDLTIRFVKATLSGELKADARVVRAGRTIVVTECDVTDADGDLVARASSSFVRRKARDGAGWVKASSGPTKLPRRPRPVS